MNYSELIEDIWNEGLRYDSMEVFKVELTTENDDLIYMEVYAHSPQLAVYVAAMTKEHEGYKIVAADVIA